MVWVSLKAVGIRVEDRPSARSASSRVRRSLEPWFVLLVDNLPSHYWKGAQAAFAVR
jgi:hypothetical protein